MYQHFLKHENLTMLLEVLLNELKVSKNPMSVENVQQIFLNNIKFFTKNSHPNMQLKELNKLFLKQVMIAINTLTPKKINILDEDIQEINTEIINEEFNVKKRDFEKYSNKNPINIDFSDTVKSDKIKNMEELINVKLNEREMEEFSHPLPLNITTDGINNNKNKQKNVSFVDIQEEIKRKDTPYEEQKSDTLPIQEKEIVVSNDLQLKYKQLIDAKPSVNVMSLSDEIARMNERMSVIENKLDIIGEQLSVLCGAKVAGNCPECVLKVAEMCPETGAK